MSFARLFAVGLIVFIVLDPPSPRSIALSAEPARFSIVIHGRKVDPSHSTIRITQGSALEVAFTADEEVELHLHGYDRLLVVKPGAVAVLRLEAKIAGRFAIEGHRFGRDAGGGRSRRHVVLLYLEVHPR